MAEDVPIEAGCGAAAWQLPSGTTNRAERIGLADGTGLSMLSVAVQRITRSPPIHTRGVFATPKTRPFGARFGLSESSRNRPHMP